MQCFPTQCIMDLLNKNNTLTHQNEQKSVKAKSSSCTFAKAFYKVAHNSLTHTLEYYGDNHQTNRRNCSFLRIGNIAIYFCMGVLSTQIPVLPGEPLCTVIPPLLLPTVIATTYQIHQVYQRQINRQMIT